MRPANGTVLHLRASNFVGGPERQILRYCSAAAPAGWRQMVASFTAGMETGAGEGWALLRAARQAGVEAYALPGGNWAAAAALRRLVDEQGVELICTHGYRADLVGTWVARRLGVAAAWFLRGWTGENTKVRLYEAADRALLPWADRVVCLSQRQAASLPARVPAERVRVVTNAIASGEIDAAAARKALQERMGWSGDGKLVAAIAGRLSPEKGARFFLQAAAKLRHKGTDMRFVVFGDGPLRAELEAERDRLGLRDCLHFAGHVADWTDLLPGLDLLVNPSLAEQAPNVVLEAMAAAVAVVATAVGSVAEIAGEPASVRLVPAGDAAALAEAMQNLADDGAQRRKLGARGRERVRAGYSDGGQRQQLQALYSDGVGRTEETGSVGAELPTVSVVLPVRNEAQHLPALLRQLLQQDYPAEKVEILIADGGLEDTDGDGTTALAQDFARRHAGRVRWLANPGRRSSAGRNCGLREARGEWVVFVDGHCELPGRSWLRAQMEAAARTGARCLSRPQPLTGGTGAGWQAVIAHTRASRIGHGADSTIYDARKSGWVHPSSSGAAYQRSLLEQIGEYDETFDACEDVEFNQRVAAAGVQAWLCPAGMVRYAARASLGGLWRQMARYGRGRARLALKHPAAGSLAQQLPALWLAWLPVGLAAALWGRGPWQWTNAAGLAAYAAVIAAYAIGLGWRHGWAHAWRAPAVYCTIHAGLGAGTWQEWFSSLRGARRAVAAAALPQESAPRSQA